MTSSVKESCMIPFIHLWQFLQQIISVVASIHVSFEFLFCLCKGQFSNELYIFLD